MHAKRRQIRIGISGWTYEPWRGVFYPKTLAHNHDAELAYASRQLNTIEINGSFYALQRPSSYLKWYSETPTDFVFAVKATRYITHIRRLNEIEKPLANFFASGVLALKEKLGPVLWQFPPSLKWDPDRFERFARVLPRSTDQALALAELHDAWMDKRDYLEIDAKRRIRHAIEVRNESFRTPEFYRLLKRHRIALVCSHSSGKWPLFDELTSDFAYIRLHGQGQLYSGGYGKKALDEWKERISSWRKEHEVFVYFDNDTKVRAPFDALSLREKLAA